MRHRLLHADRFFLGAMLASSLFLTSVPSLAHGGTYRGPGDGVPPGGGGGSGGSGAPGTPGPGGPSNPGGSGPVTPGSTTPGATGPGLAGRGPTTGGATQAGPDLSVWDFWWAFNRSPYLDLRQRVRAGSVDSDGDNFYLGRGQAKQGNNTRRPGEDMVRNTVVPALLNVLRTERDNDLLTGALISLAKIGEVQDYDGSGTFQEAIVRFLASGEQEVSETAAIALGVLADERAAPVLMSLMRDDPAGRRLVGGKAVPARTRAFAAYGLGLVGHRTDSNELRREIDAHLIEILDGPRLARPDIKVGALAALGLIPLDWTGSAAATDAVEDVTQDRTAVIRYLVRRMGTDTRGEAGFKDFRVRSQAPIAAARLLASHESDLPDGALVVRRELIERLLELVDGRTGDKRTEVLQSATIALGMIGNAASGDGAISAQNRRIFAELTRIGRDAANNQTEFFALVALAQLGSRKGPGDMPRGLQTDVQKELIAALARGRGQKKPWAALALGIFGHGLQESNGVLDAAVVRVLRDVARKGDRPDEAGAYAIALGLVGDVESEDLLLERLEFFSQDDTRGHIAVGLGLMQARGALEPLTDVLQTSKFRPELLRQAAVGIGLLGDQSAANGLVEMLRTARGFQAQAAIANALGTIGAASSVQPLVEMMTDTSITDSARGFAAVALGIVCDKELLPWNSKIAVNSNYRANVATLTNSMGTGILDIL